MKNSSTIQAKTRLLPIMGLGIASFTLIACQQEPETDTVVVEESAAPVTTPDTETVVNNETDQQTEATTIEDTPSERDVELKSLENNLGAAGVTPNAETTTPNPEQAIKGTQITDVEYRSASGESLSVVFETSATGVLNAIVTLPNKPRMTLSAPEGQGNNPTYRSKDGSIELVSHGGGSSIDVLQNGKTTSYEATSAEAEVVTQP
ncbi:hypothetical protein ACS8E3_04060 [Psychrobacter sp. 2Y5]|uniref:hypothetical protein n=1 Tax=unclassified Psychrobacter TaxID=196806 RepID=UPI003F45B577